MRPYSEDIRTRVIRAYQNREGSQRQIASRFNVSLGFVRTLLKRYRDTGNFSPKAHVGPASKIDRKSLQLILHMVDANPSFPLSRLCDQLAQERQLRVSRSTMWRTVKKYRPNRARLSSMRQNDRAGFHRGSSSDLTYATRDFSRDGLTPVSVPHSSETLLDFSSRK